MKGLRKHTVYFASPTRGIVKWFSTAAQRGFLKTDDGEELFMHFPLSALDVDDYVEFQVAGYAHTRKAINITKVIYR